MADVVDVTYRRRKVYKSIFDPLFDFDDGELIRRYRFDSAGIEFLCNILRAELEYPSRRSRAISVETQVLTTLRYLASGSFQQVIGDTLNISQPSASRCIDRVVSALCNHAKDYVAFPERDSMDNTYQEFYSIAGFPRVCGCIDGTHIRILAPHDNSLDYINRKGFHSINVQAVCDHRGIFTNIVAKWPGSSHDSWILRQSGLWNLLENSPNLGYLLGDAGYPCRPWLITPYTNPSTTSRQRFNNSHKRTRVLIEQCFGRWKRRFGILHSEIRTSPEKACRIITACAMLHNIAILRKYPEVDAEGDDIIDDINEDIVQNLNNGNAYRDAIANAHFQ